MAPFNVHGSTKASQGRSDLARYGGSAASALCGCGCCCCDGCSILTHASRWPYSPRGLLERPLHSRSMLHGQQPCVGPLLGEFSRWIRSLLSFSKNPTAGDGMGTSSGAGLGVQQYGWHGVSDATQLDSFQGNGRRRIFGRTDFICERWLQNNPSILDAISACLGGLADHRVSLAAFAEPCRRESAMCG